MRYGAVFPTTEIGSDPIAVRDFAQAAEELGYARLTAYDHVLGAEHADRDTTTFGSEMLIDYALGPETWHEHASAWEQAGGSIISMRAMSTGSRYMKVPVPNFSSPDQHLDALEIFMREMAG